MPRLLSTIDEIDREWLASVFAEAGMQVPEIKGVQIEPIGAGNTGITVRALIDYVQSDTPAPKSVVCKFHPNDERIEMVKAAGVFITEANTLKLLAEHSEAAIPICYSVQVNEDGSQFNLVCEDLSERCDLGDQIKGCTIPEARAAVIELAKLHRQFWNESTLSTLAWVRPRMPLPDNALDLLEGRLSALLTDDQHNIVKQTTPHIYDWLAATPQNHTLIHVDCRVDNVLFDNADPNSPQAFLIDFALATVGDAAADVAYLLTSSLTPEDRLACEIELLTLHTQEIANKDPAYTIDIATAAYRENIVSSLYLTMIAALGMPDVPEANLLLTRLFERNCAAVDHWLLN